MDQNYDIEWAKGLHVTSRSEKSRLQRLFFAIDRLFSIHFFHFSSLLSTSLLSTSFQQTHTHTHILHNESQREQLVTSTRLQQRTALFFV